MTRLRATASAARDVVGAAAKHRATAHERCARQSRRSVRRVRTRLHGADRAHEQAKRGIADVFEKRLEMEVRSLSANAERSFEAAGEAAQRGDDSKARSLLEREAFLTAQRDRLLGEVTDVRAQRKTLEATTEILHRRLEAMRSERLELQARYATAKATIRATEHVTGLSREMSDVARLIEGAREESLTVQARAAALADIAGTASGALGTSGSAAIESRLAALKARAALPVERDAGADA